MGGVISRKHETQTGRFVLGGVISRKHETQIGRFVLGGVLGGDLRTLHCNFLEFSGQQMNNDVKQESKMDTGPLV